MTDSSLSILSSVLDTMSDPTLILQGMEMRIVAANQAVAHKTGYCKEQLLQSSLAGLLAQHNPNAITPQIAALSAGNSVCLAGNSLQSADGGQVAVSLCFRRIQELEAPYFILTIKPEGSCWEGQPIYTPDSRFPLMPLLANAPVCVAVFHGPEHHIMSTNKFNLQITGKQDIIGKRAMDAFPEAESEEFLRLLDYVYKSGKSFTSEETLIHLNKTPGMREDRFMNFLYQPYLNDACSVEGVLFFGMDVTAQVLACKKTEESERRYRRIVETAREGIWTIDEHDVINFVNSKMCEIMDCPEEEMIGKKVFDFMDATGKDIAWPLIRNEASITSMDFMFVTKTGRSIWTTISANPIYDEDQQYRGALAMITDITERRQAECRVHQSEERFRNLVEHNEDVVIMADGDWNILYESSSMERLTGFTTAERSLGGLHFIHPDDRAGITGTMAQVLQNPGVRYYWRHRRLHKAGHYIWTEGTIINKLHDESVQAIFANLRDITQRKNAEEALWEKNEQLRSLSAYLQNIQEQERAAIAREIHDQLGQQLTGLIMETSWIQKKLRALDLLLYEKTSGLLQQINDTISTVRRISTDLRPAILDDFGLAEALEWQAAEFEQQTGISCVVETSLSGDIADRHIALTLFRVFQETLTNVARHARASAVQAHIRNDASILSLTITDDGIGIDEDFVRHKRTLGLLGMRERIAMLNGEFSILRNGDTGTITQVTVPYEMQQGLNHELHA